ncbi:MAG: hypothetical protein UH687_01435 [Bacteroidaceae bacterium]|nr:hypothetical protein [Bacteroidaceae bacterium]
MEVFLREEVIMGQYWTRKGDQEDKDERTVCPWTEHAGHGDRFMPEP